jgi:LysM repeat protein/predicted alpha/beta-hydrolase family hydrolase
MTGLRRVTIALLALITAAAGHHAALAGPAGMSGPVGNSLISPPTPETSPPVNLAPPKVYLFRGALGPIFSTGMDRLAEKIEKAGFQANVYEFTLCDFIESRVAKAYREQPGPIVLIGHSMGGLCSVRIAIALQEEHIPVSLVVAIDPAHATKSVPLNVERFINIFLSDNVLGGGDVKPEPGFRGHYASYDMKDHDEVTHINIDKMADVHAQLVNMIGQLAQISPAAETDPVPLRYLVPPKVSVELWDSGIPLFVRPGDTLEQISANYHLPLWALQQANQGAGSAPLIPGERIVIPRHLLPASATAPEATASTASVAARPGGAPAQSATRRAAVTSAAQGSSKAGVSATAQPGGKNGMIIGTRRQ